MSHSHTNLLIHVIYATKRRQPLLTNREIRNRLHEYIGGVLRKNGAQPLGINGVEDHLHILMSIHPDLSISSLIKESKRASSIWIKPHGQEYSSFHWQRGYAAYSVSQSMKSRVQRYIARQEEHHQRVSLREEWEAFREANGIPTHEPRHPSG